MDALSNIIWESLRKEADQSTKDERLLVAYLEETVLGQNSFEAALSYTLASKMRDDILPSITLRDLFFQILELEKGLRECILIDLQAVKERDPAAGGYLSPFLFFKGFHALSAYRFAHYLWSED
ncbi:MAG: serine O-acetyltransferase, partial [Verrucomicrobia bacterium TMED71]